MRTSLLSLSHQYELLRRAVAEDHPAQAAQMAEWSIAAQEGLLLHLASVALDTSRVSIVELWKVNKNGRELRCVAQYLSTGIDVRLLEGEGFRRTQLCHTAPEANELNDKWLAALVERGWQKDGA